MPPLPAIDKMQNIHPVLPFYQHDLPTTAMSHDQLASLLQLENEMDSVKLLQETGVIANCQQCKYCGSIMKISKQEKYLYWICHRRFEGQKCN